VAEVQAPATRGVDQQLEDGSPYYYQVRAVDQDGLEGKPSTVVSSVTKPVPVKPRELKAQWEGQRVRLTWAPNPEKDIQKYTIAQKSFLLFWEKIGESSGTEYYYQGEWKKGKRLSFRITAIDQDRLEGEPSEEAEVTVP
jgi:fibronectin type 3 domain-containing protein